MNILRFIGLLFLFFGILASSVMAVTVIVTVVHFWPVLLVVILAILLLSAFFKQTGIQITGRA
ncbi:hypothetical protein [Pseudomonas simiae]|jgi:type IV secretory pathway TrbL component|uniref:Uncharacterized protein n=1 Tax=Pseudomonas simiae TaxID=321846 RepID=A0A1N7UFN9_9PSED|nr:hypothetical protein [Pseudomonas simiae]AIB38764.1 hypothetical protein PS417_24895 [Pseudomonas simiae]